MCCRDIPPPMKGEIFYSNVEANISRIRNARFRDDAGIISLEKWNGMMTLVYEFYSKRIV